MERMTHYRAIALLLLFSLVLGLFGFRMYGLQVRDAGPQDAGLTTFTTWSRVTAARGEILDRNGNVLASNRASYNLVFNNYVFLYSDQPNESLRKLLHLLQEENISYIEHFPVTFTKPYEYISDQISSEWMGYFKRYLNDLTLDSDISAAQLMKQLRAAYRIPNSWSDEDARRVIGVRYEMALRSDLTTLPAYTLKEDVSGEELSLILELNTPGLSVETSTVREYATEHCAHILGYTTMMYAQDYEELKDKGYSMDARIGRTGFEAAFEEYLHGTDGVKLTTVDSDGNIISEYFTTEPKAGANVETTIDLPMQIAAEEALENAILTLREKGVGAKAEGKDAEGGAVVAIEVATGKVLACASYPTYNPQTFWEDYKKIEEIEFGAFNNRALQMTYAPGSTFKMAVTIAAINEGKIASGTVIEDQGVYTKYEDYQPQCLVYTNYGRTHGSINVMEALMVSCNYYFYEAGTRVGMPAIDAVAKGLGLGEKTGVELYEEKGRRSNEEAKKEIYGDDYTQNGWYDADTLQLSIGQGENRFTPIQLATYTATLANWGTRYRTTFLNRIISSDYQSLLVQNEPEVVSRLDICDDAYYAYTRGMLKVATDPEGTAYSYLKDYPITVAAKTGTAQHGGSGSDNASFVCYAPYENPEIAIAVFVEKGAQGGYLANVAKAIMDVYFEESEIQNSELPGENVAG